MNIVKHIYVAHDCCEIFMSQVLAADTL